MSFDGGLLTSAYPENTCNHDNCETIAYTYIPVVPAYGLVVFAIDWLSPLVHSFCFLMLGDTYHYM